MQKIKRQKELDKLSILKDRNLIKVITGVRRCGKSTLLLQFQEILKTENPLVSIVSINLDFPEFRFLAEKSWKEVYDYIQNLLQKGIKNYVFIDEIQNIPEFEKLLEGLFVNPDVDLYVTGSNAYLLSSELATLLTGRAFEINVLPFSFAEYLEYTNKSANPDRAFADYMRTGGFPEAVGLAQESENFAYEYLDTVFQNIYQNDIQKRHTIYYETSYKKVVHFLIDSVGSSVSAGNIAKVLTANGKRIDNKTVSKYIDTLVESYLFYKVNRYDIKGKQYLATLEKYYLVDLGLRYALLGKELSVDAGRLLENVIFLELQRRDEQVWIGKADNLEVDFVARGKDGYTKYIQVALTVKEQKTLERELAPFSKIPDYNERLLITMDYEKGSHNGVKQINAIDWLLNK
ncbi:ATP-binding protein [Bacteroidales bacterium OttesenSCG-928-B11]|nr:ATP-binding protein [Bacteroidales bacterium OttesenSCG-928-E04]MDL2308693.1 ATP-binding protein [Bacteroidales bacterium OttesenSCG-928-C03]MDL2311952.1 ATP-binding protein [Bacteroidales bacterium OttesenSCG-928-B11]